MSDVDGFVNVIGKISTLVGFGQQLQEIFGGTEPLTIADIEAAIRQEIAAALREQEIETEIVNASATLQSVQRFIDVDYFNAVKFGESQSQILDLLTHGTIAQYIADMENNVNALQIMMNGADLRTAVRGIPVSLGLHLYLSIIPRERAKYSDGESDKQAALADMRTYARNGVRDIAPRLDSLISGRLADLTYLSDDNPNVTDVGGIPIQQYCTIDSLHDAWFDTWLFAFKANNDPSMDYAAALHWVMRASRNLLWSGAQADADDLSNSLTDGWLRVPQVLGQGSVPWADNFRDTCLDADTALGKVFQGARTALVGLDAIAFGYVGTEQDTWSWCTSCGSLYFAGAPSVCPAANGRPHVHEQPSANYVLRCDPVEPAANRQGDWRWCKKCSALFFDQGRNSCAAGGQHDSSASSAYALDLAPIPGLDVLGLPNAQDSWRRCTKCSALHFGSGPSVCPGGGAHDPTGSGNYWLSSFSMSPQPS
ncbi:hypothetical protein [Bradyrhizobium betae]|uniref:Uncharacterized protein n=1 Tax=Bradyrhizobium betae TaxID=244734 RepID=A0A5P6P3K8_9BRAD|nr:hypothetical protein [Bradyrhizobium betae]MCS3728568.1 hypothetical protein [Bradyrhizobium betae]QFI72776.1 hypothetical protein F8237_10430 [Bradyrhizobium betae]